MQEVKSIGLLSKSNRQEGRKGVDSQVFNSVACILLEDLVTQWRDPMWDHWEGGVEVHSVGEREEGERGRGGERDRALIHVYIHVNMHD